MRLIKNDDGQGLVEFALIVPILILILMAIIEFGFMFNAYLSLSNGVREGGRLAALGGSDVAIEAKVAGSGGFLKSENVQVDISPVNRKRGDQITLVASYDYEFITPILGGLFPSGVELNSELRVRME